MRRRCNCIDSLKDEFGTWISGRANIGNHIASYFKNLFTASSHHFPHNLEDLIPEVISASDNYQLCVVPEATEIYAAVKSLGATKAPRPDGFTALFCQRYWPSVREKVIRMVRNFFLNRYLQYPRLRMLLCLIARFKII